ncbi:MAG: glycosyltransferase family 1 protein [Clostridium sp.]|uniref:glycosyltransferase family 1 protein n=1 Tax=Clostridium sp. TaxID=1506 RepID=UPI00302E3AE2
MKKKILHVTGAMNMGGTETMLINLYRKVNNDIIFDFISYSQTESYYDKEIKALGGNVIRLEEPNKSGFFKSINDLRKIIKNNGHYDAVHTHMLFNSGIAMVAAFLSGVKVRVSHAHTTSDNSITWIRKIYITVMRILIRIFSTNLIACSGAAGKYLFGHRIVRTKRCSIIPNCIDYEKFIDYEDRDRSIRGELGIAKNDIVIGHIGRFIPAKNHSFLLEIIADLVGRNPSVKCILVGDGDLRESIESGIKRYNLENNVYLLGIRNDVERIFKSMDVFVLPSTYEGLGLVLLEAQASGIPCITSQAIQPEADLGIGLIKKLNLQANIEIWSKSILKVVNHKKRDKAQIRDAFENKGYTIGAIKNTLYSIYSLNGEIEEMGESSEKYIDNIL